MNESLLIELNENLKKVLGQSAPVINDPKAEARAAVDKWWSKRVAKKLKQK